MLDNPNAKNILEIEQKNKKEFAKSAEAKVRNVDQIVFKTEEDMERK